jgi:PIN domain nuclease of toxin-antitoxin system
LGAVMLLLDTCALLWLVNNRAELSPGAVRAIDRTRDVFVSAASAFEIGTKHRQGKLLLATAPPEWWAEAIARLELIELAITAEVALAATVLPTEIIVDGRRMQHRDPGDRFIVATALTQSLVVVTPDPKIAAYPNASVLW